MGKDTRYFQWLVGEKQGEIQIFDKIVGWNPSIFSLYFLSFSFVSIAAKAYAKHRDQIDFPILVLR